MEQLRRLIELDDDVYLPLCPEFDIASQGSTIAEAWTNLIQALTPFFETADREEINFAALQDSL